MAKTGKGSGDGSLLSVVELSAKLGISAGWVYQGCTVGVKVGGSTARLRLPHYRLGSSLRFSLPEIMAFLKEGGKG